MLMIAIVPQPRRVILSYVMVSQLNHEGSLHHNLWLEYAMWCHSIMYD